MSGPGGELEGEAGPARPLPWPTLGLLCSVQCPGSVILRLYDLVRALRDAGVVVVGGFQSPMERECLDLLLRGSQPVIVCTARVRKTLPSGWKAAIAEGRLRLISPPGATGARTTAAMAERRNAFVANMADAVLIAYASPGGKTERLASGLITTGKPLYTIDDPANDRLLALGAVAYPATSPTRASTGSGNRPAPVRRRT
jgi:hypothetical protein